MKKLVLQFDASPEELKLFLEEAEEHLQLLEEELVRLEQESDDEELLQGIFRSAHTLKGSSATLGHQRMAQLTHYLENVFDKIRKKQLSITTSVMDVVFESLDNLKILKEEIETLEESDIDLEGIVKKLQVVAEGQAAPVQESPKKTQQEKQQGLSLDWEEREGLKQEVAEGQNVYQIAINMDENSDMLSVRALITLMTLRELGYILKSEPSSEEIESEQVKGRILAVVISANSAEQIKKAIEELPDIKEVTVNVWKDEEAKEAPALPESLPVAQSPEQSTQMVAETNQPKAAKETKIGKPSRTVRVDVELLDNLMNLIGELVIDRTRLTQIIGEVEGRIESNDLTEELNRTSVHIGRVTTLLQEEIMKARMLPVESLFSKFPRMMRDLSQKAGKEIDFVMEGQETELDRSIIEEIGDPLIHLLRNAVDHAVESPEEREAANKPRKGKILLRASHEENHIIIMIRDDGKGIDPEKIKASAIKKGYLTEEAARRLTDQEAIHLIFASGLSTKTQVSEVSGRGVGMDVVRNNLEKVNGSIEIETAIGKGTTFKIKLPLTLAIIRALLVSVDKRVYAVPLTSVTETIRLDKNQIKEINKREAIVVRGRVLPLLHLRSLFNHGTIPAEDKKIFVVVVNLGGQQLGIVVDYLIGEQEVVIKSLGKFIGDVQGVAGATILGDGSVALIVDVSSLMKKLGSIQGV